MSKLRYELEKTVSKHCPFIPFDQIDYAINISLKHNYLYTETPKVACSTIKTILQQIELELTHFQRIHFEDIHFRQYSPLLKPSQIGNFDDFLQKNIFKFCFVRNPYTRLLSAYLDKIQKNQPMKKSVLLHLGKNSADLSQAISFEEFVHVVCEQPISNMDPHWRIQYFQTFQQGIQYDFIGKLENINDDLNFVINRLNLQPTPTTHIEDRHATHSNDLIHQFYKPDLLKMVEKKYAIDFEHFNYPIL